MSCSIIVNGAAGRMGATIAGLVRQDPDLTLAGVAEAPGKEDALAAYDCPASDDVGRLAEQVGRSVVIDFTAPAVTMKVARACAAGKLAAVIGTTGLTTEQTEELRELAEKAPIFWAPNMSVGVNVLLAVLPMLVERLGAKYDLELSEIHHNKKKDAPSGTAIKLAQCLAEARGVDYENAKQYCREGIIGERPMGEIGVQTLRGGDVVGDHTVYFLGPGERIEVTHRAHSRETFAQGALRAAKWMWEQEPGRLYTMADMFAE